MAGQSRIKATHLKLLLTGPIVHWRMCSDSSGATRAPKHGISTYGTKVVLGGALGGSDCATDINYWMESRLMPNWQNGLGLNSMCARVGGILAPLIRLLDVYHFTIPMLIYGIVPIAAAGFCLLLPETLNVELQDHAELKKPVNGPTRISYSAEKITEEHKL